MNPSDTSPSSHRAGRAPFARWIFAASAVLVLAAFLARPLFDKFSPSVLPVLAIMNFENAAPGAAADLSGEVIASLAVTDLATAQKIRVLSRQQVFDALQQLDVDMGIRIDPVMAVEIGALTGATWLLTGMVASQSPEFIVTTELLEVKTGKAIASHRITGAAGESVFIVADRVVGEIRADLELAPRAGRGAVSDVTTRSVEAYSAYVMGEESRFRGNSGAGEHFARAAAHDSTFAMAHARHSEYLTGPEKRAALERAARYAARATEPEQRFIGALFAGKEEAASPQE